MEAQPRQAAPGSRGWGGADCTQAPLVGASAMAAAACASSAARPPVGPHAAGRRRFGRHRLAFAGRWQGGPLVVQRESAARRGGVSEGRRPCPRAWQSRCLAAWREGAAAKRGHGGMIVQRAAQKGGGQKRGDASESRRARRRATLHERRAGKLATGQGRPSRVGRPSGVPGAAALAAHGRPPVRPLRAWGGRGQWLGGRGSWVAHVPHFLHSLGGGCAAASAAAAVVGARESRRAEGTSTALQCGGVGSLGGRALARTPKERQREERGGTKFRRRSW
jgi:hypothetical protein